MLQGGRDQFFYECSLKKEKLYVQRMSGYPPLGKTYRNVFRHSYLEKLVLFSFLQRVLEKFLCPRG